MASPRPRQSSFKKRQPVNRQISASKVRLISESGEQLGIVAIEEAMKKASAASLDLVQLASDSDHPVCKLMDYGKHLFDKKKQKSASRKKQKRTQVKEIKFRPGTEENDYKIKLKSIMRFIQDGDKAKITMRFRGREMAHQNLGFGGGELLKRIETDLTDQAVVEQEPQSEGRQLVMVMSPAKKKN
ncbi:MAG: translation initiation factor IF-3 [Gammaproteobacteria bacterium]